LEPGEATIPFLFPSGVVLIKDVPAEICSSCHEPYATGSVTDRLVDLLSPLHNIQAEVLLLSYETLSMESNALIEPVMA
jgi:YgiT-type zinc finger domain-containing protein